MNYTKLFYWLSVADNAKDFFIVSIILFSIISAISTLWFVVDRDQYDLTASKNSGAERAKKWMWWSYPFSILFWSLYIFTPSKKDTLLIVAGGQTLNYLTTDSTAKKIPHELINFVLIELEHMAKDAKVDLNIATQKEKIINEAKQMTGEELIEKLKSDSTLRKVILK